MNSTNLREGERESFRSAAADTRLFADTLSIDATMPIKFVPGPVLSAERRRAMERAVNLLANLPVIEDCRLEDEGLGGEPALTRLDAKINILMDMLGDVLRTSLRLPQARVVKWSRLGIRMEGAFDPISPGQIGMVHLLLSPRLPYLIELPANLIEMDQQSSGLFRQWLVFDNMDEALRTVLDRHLIRLNRRALADSRHAG